VVVLGRQVSAVRTRLNATYSLEVEFALVALVLLAWQAVRIPLEGSVAASLDHSVSVLRLESALGIDIEASAIRRAAETGIAPTLSWLYSNIHLPILFGFIAAVRLLRPDRYPRVRTIFVLSFVPAVVVIGAYPLAPPRWLSELGMGPAPREAELGSSGALFHNETAAAASQHFGFALFVAAVTLWLFPRSRFLWPALAYPALVFVVIVGTGNHYVIDCVVGTLTFVLAALTARLLHGRTATAEVTAQPGSAPIVALGYALVAWGLVSLDFTTPATWNNVGDALILALGLALVLSPRFGVKEAVTESGRA
jgi:PAP2 superfamily